MESHRDNNMRISSPSARTIIAVKDNVQGKSSSEVDNSKSLEFLNDKYKMVKTELDESRRRIDELEQSLVVRVE